MPHRSMCAFWTLNEPWPNAACEPPHQFLHAFSSDWLSVFVSTVSTAGLVLKFPLPAWLLQASQLKHFNLAADGSVVDWFGVKKSGYYTATRKVYSQVDVSLTYSSLFLLANEPLPPITPWVVSERSVQGSLSLSVSTTAGKSLHEQSWNVNVTVPRDEMGVALEMPSPVPTPLNSSVHRASHLTVMITKETCSNTSEQVSWAMPPGELAGEVLLFRLTLTPASSADAAASSDGISSQLYTFAVLPPGSSVPTPLNQSPQSFSSITLFLRRSNRSHISERTHSLAQVHDKMDKVLPMRPLLHAPAAQCALSKPVCSDDALLAGAGSCTVVLSNTGATPCLCTLH